jgi:hypothetical protein
LASQLRPVRDTFCAADLSFWDLGNICTFRGFFPRSSARLISSQGGEIVLHARHSIAFAGFGLLTSTFALGQGRPYVYREVAAGGTGTGNGLSFLPPLINNNGTVAFYATKGRRR